MGWNILKNKIPFRTGGGTSWSSYWLTLISAIIEDAAPTNVVLTFPTAKPALGATDFTIAGFTISSASWTGSVLTLVLSTAVIYGDSLTVTFVPTGGTNAVTNNVAIEAETIALIARMTAVGETPVAARQIVINNTIRRLKVAGIWAKLDCLWMMAAHGVASAKLNWIQDAYNITAANNPTFTTDVGFSGNGSSSHLKTGFQPYTHGVKYTQNNASFGFSKSSNTGSGVLLGSHDTAPAVTAIALSNTIAWINNDTSVTLSSANIIGNLIVTRLNTAIALYQNGSPSDSDTSASVTLPDLEVMILARNLDGAANGFSNETVDFVFFGAYLTPTEISTLDSILR